MEGIGVEDSECLAVELLTVEGCLGGGGGGGRHC